MSDTYFGADQSSQTTQESQTEDYLGKVIAAKGEQWKDPNTLAKGYLAAQEFIEQLKKEKAGIEEDLKKQDYSKQLLETFKQSKPAQVDQPNTTSAPDESSLRALIDQTLTARERENTAKQNIDLANKKLEEMFGTEAIKTVEAKRLELGLSKERLQEIASESPTAFLRLIGDPAPKQDNRTVKGSLNTSVFTANPSERNFQYYQKLRKENPKQYNTPATQNAMMEDRIRLGDRFY